MSSTDPDSAEMRVRRFFDESLMPAARKLAERDSNPCLTKPEPDRDTYYVARAKTTMERADFEVPGLDAPEHLASGLRSFWERRGSVELAGLSAELAGLARELRVVEEQTDEVSPFIYVMF